MWLGINNYRPDFFEDSNEFINKHNVLLTSLKGQIIREIYVLWNITEDEWYSSAPVILVTDTIQIELCANKLNEYSITHDTINIDSEVEPADLGDEEVWYFEWRKKTEGIRPNLIITGIDIIEMRYDTTVIHDNINPKNVGQEFINWILHGIGIHTADNYLSFYNGFDCNGIGYVKEITEYFR